MNSRQNTSNSRPNKINSRQNTINSRPNKINSRQNTINSRQNKVISQQKQSLLTASERGHSRQNKENELVSVCQRLLFAFEMVRRETVTLLARKPPFLSDDVIVIAYGWHAAFLWINVSRTIYP